jgi:hypothetical protein
MWSSIPEDILYLILHFIDTDDTNRLCDQSDWLWGAFPLASFRSGHHIKRCVLAVRQVCSRWREIAMHSAQQFPIWMTAFQWKHDIAPQAIFGAAREALLRYDGHTDYAVWASVYNAHDLNLFYSNVVVPCRLQIRLLRFAVKFDMEQPVVVDESFPKLIRFAYEGISDMAMEFTHPISKLGRLTFHPTPIRDLVGIDDNLDPGSHPITAI